MHEDISRPYYFLREYEVETVDLTALHDAMDRFNMETGHHPTDITVHPIHQVECTKGLFPKLGYRAAYRLWS